MKEIEEDMCEEEEEEKTFYFEIHGKFYASDEAEAFDKLYNVLKGNQLEAMIDSLEEESRNEELE